MVTRVGAPSHRQNFLFFNPLEQLLDRGRRFVLGLKKSCFPARGASLESL
jgi:hypothetical protein